MVIKDEDVFLTVLAALHPEMDGLIGGSIPKDRRELITINVDNYTYMCGGKNDPGESIIQTASREAEEEGWGLAKGATVYEVFRGSKIGIGLNTSMFFSVCVCDTPMIKLKDYKEKYRGVEQRKLTMFHIESLWESGDSTKIVHQIYRDVLNGRKNIPPINFRNGKWIF